MCVGDAPSYLAQVAQVLDSNSNFENRIEISGEARARCRTDFKLANTVNELNFMWRRPMNNWFNISGKRVNGFQFCYFEGY